MVVFLEVVVVIFLGAAVVVAPTSHIARVRSLPELMVLVNASSSANRFPLLLPSLKVLDISGLDAMPCIVVWWALLISGFVYGMFRDGFVIESKFNSVRYKVGKPASLIWQTQTFRHASISTLYTYRSWVAR